MNRSKNSVVSIFVAIVFLLSGCGKSAAPGGAASTGSVITAEQGSEKIKISSDEPSVYIPVVSAKASSFDLTPDWAPEPDPMASVDGDMNTRWSSSYTEGDQWISFYLGTDSVVNDIIIRWERAYATGYKIFVSEDESIWKEVYYEQNSNGGTDELSFTPVRCNYVKIVGLKRVNEDWGISIWEVEMFGPATHNTGSTVRKEDYLSRDKKGSKLEEEARNLVIMHRGIASSIEEKEFQKGVVYTSWMADELSLPVSDITLTKIKQVGYDSVAIMVAAYQEELDSTEIFTNDVPGGDTPTMESLKHAIETCHKLGLRVMLKPHVDPRTDEARINIMPSEAWFDSYERFILKYARFAQENGVELYSIGTELEATTFEAWTHRWDQIIDKVKQEYTGALTYSANWTEYKEVPFWDKMDFIGIDAYFPLSDQNSPLIDQLVTAWSGIADDIESWLAEKDLTEKGVLFTEVGYPSADGAARQPWAAITRDEDMSEQAYCLEAMFKVLTERTWFRGYYIWQYFPQKRWSPLGFTVGGKEAEGVIQKWVQQT